MQERESESGAANIRAHEGATQEEVYFEYTEAQQTKLDQMKASAQIYNDLTKSIAPQVYGHEDVKRAVLLMLFGGVHKETKEVKKLQCTMHDGAPNGVASSLMMWLHQTLNL